MDDERELLEQERRRHRMSDDAFHRLRQRRDRKRRNRMITSGVLALVVAAAGGTGVVLAFRNTGTAPAPLGSSSVTPSTSPSEAPSSSPTVVPPPGAPPPTSAAIQFVDADHGWWVGQGGEIVATDDGGTSSSTLYSGPVQISAVQFIDVQHGWAISSDGRLLQTDDGGKNLTDLSATAADGPALSFSSVQFLSSSSGWGVADAALFRTGDGGQTWTPVETAARVESACGVGDVGGRIWAAGPGGQGPTVMMSTDGGANWTATTIDVPQEEPWTTSVRCGDPDEAWLLLTDGGAAGHQAYVVFHTGDGGESWDPVLQEAGTSPVGQRQDVYASNDPSPGALTVTGANSAAFVGWCPPCGNSVSLVRTSDRGKTWDQVEVAAPNKGGEPQGLSFVDPGHGSVLFTAQTDQGSERVLAIIVGSKVTIVP